MNESKFLVDLELNNSSKTVWRELQNVSGWVRYESSKQKFLYRALYREELFRTQ